MTAVVSREHAKATCLTGAAGMLLLAVAVVMMVVAAPAQVHGRAPGLPKSSAVQLTTDACHQLTPRSDSATARACQAGPVADSARAEAYVPSLTSGNWSASRPVRPAAADPR